MGRPQKDAFVVIMQVLSGSERSAREGDYSKFACLGKARQPRGADAQDEDLCLRCSIMLHAE